MNAEKRKQLTLSAVFIVLICIFMGLGFWLRGNPLFSGQGLRWKEGPVKPAATYAPYESAIYPDVAPTAAVPAMLSTGDNDALYRFYTTERATVFTFSGLGGGRELHSILDALKKTNSRATFFVTADDLENRADQIEEIVRAGHSLGIGVKLMEGTRAGQLAGEIQAQADTIRSRYQAHYELFVRPSYGAGSPALQQAAAAGNFRVLTEMKEAVPERVSRMTDPEEIIAETFKENEGKLQRGEIVHFQMGLFQYSDTVIGDLVERIVAEKCVYPVLPADEVASETSELYVYPVPNEKILRAVRNKIYPGHLKGMTSDEIFEVIRNGYIGIPWIVSNYFMPGFTENEARRLDKTGVIPDVGNSVFLTFDDWGTDGVVDELLSVLAKHDATATFFVRTEHVHNNPNLLRSIAAAGHTIGAHSHRHLSLSTEVQPTYFVELTEDERKTLEDDIVQCYDVLQHVVGDMVDADGKPSLSLLFRQPTLAVGRNGLETVFDCGYTHAVAGCYTATDYNATDAVSLAKELKKNIVPGGILVMHFSDAAVYTPAALDMLLSELEAANAGYEFVGLNKVL